MITKRHYILNFCLITALCLGLFSYPNPNTIRVNASEEQQLSEIERQQKSINSSIDNINGDLEETGKLSTTLKEELNKLTGEIVLTDQLIVESENLLAKIKLDIEKNQSDLNILISEMKILLIELQKQNEVSPLESILSSANLSEAISKLYNLSALQSKADSLRLQVEETSRKLESSKSQQEESIKKLNEIKAVKNSKKSTTESLIARTKNDENNYQKLRKDLLEQSKDIQKQIEEAEKEAQQQLRQPSQPNNPGGNGNTNPSPNYGNDNTGCWFEDRRTLSVPSGYFTKPTNGSFSRGVVCSQHDGIDISNSANTELYSIADGTVARKGFGDIFGYGNYVIIRHNLPSGQRIYSLYAHMNSGSPKAVGQNVSRGEVIGYMGCTGLCFGTHLHFMIYSDTYETTGPGCRLGRSKCYNPLKFINPIN